MARKYTQQTVMHLASLAGNKCAFPDCNERMVRKGTDGLPKTVGEIAHITASSDCGPRADPTLSSAQRNEYHNLILLCPNHHTTVDQVPSDYPPEVLRRFKRDIEALTDAETSRSAPLVSFSELDIVCKAILDGATEQLPSTEMTAVPPQAKMEANELTEAVEPLMKVGFGLAPEVAKYIQHQAKMHSRFPERLRAGFVQEYNRLQTEQGLHGDDLFRALIVLSQKIATSSNPEPTDELVIRAAAAAAVCHLFSVCDLFDAPPELTV